MTRPARTRPNERAIITSILLANTAVAITDAIEHIAIELARCDGYGGGGTSETGRVSGGQRTVAVPYIDDHGHADIDHVPVTSVEAVVLARYHLTSIRETIRDDLNEIERLTKRLARTTARALGQRAPTEPTLCRDGGIGKDLTPDLTGRVATCHERPHAQGLCNTHYVAWRREQRAAGIDTSGMYEPA